MRIAALYDIHGNLPALEAVLTEVRRFGVDQIVVGGDVVPGPLPCETLECLSALALPVHFIYGNGERAVLAQRAGQAAALPEQARVSVEWTAQQLSAEHESMLQSWPQTLALTLPEVGRLLFCHATPRNENECFTRETAEARLVPIFTGLEATHVICGHTHMQFERTIGNTHVLNAGSVGMPFGQAGAHWLLLTPQPQLMRTEYDLAHAAARIRQCNYPQAEAFAQQAILQPPTEAQMLAVFAKVELQP